MTQKQRSPREAGIGHRLAGWVRMNANTLGDAALLALLLGALLWHGVRA